MVLTIMVFFPAIFSNGFPNDVINGKVWNLRYRASVTMGSYITRLFNSYFVKAYDAAQIDGPQFWGNSFQTDLFSNTEALLGLVMSTDLNATMRRLTESLTETIRTRPNSTSVIGQALVSKSFIQLRWAWLALPLMLLTMTCALLIVVAVNSYSNNVTPWKDDPLALLFHSVNGAEILPGGSSKTRTSDLDNLADEVCVRLDQYEPFKFIVSTKKTR